MSEVVAFSVDQWSEIGVAFVDFFGSLGSVIRTGDELTFDGGDTGLTVRADGTSRSLMPLHELGARWDTVTFDPSTWRVVLRSSDVEYVYRVPPRLIPA